MLGALPRIDRLELATVTRVPEWHPEHAAFRPFPVHAWLIHHPEGPILVDTGIGSGQDLLDELYAPVRTPLPDALRAVGLEPGDIVAVVLSHLHFDHCGQQQVLTAPTFVQAAEVEAARQPRYTVPAWASIDPARLRRVNGDLDLIDGVRLLATPGHTPGHQSVVVEAGGERVVLAAQCAFVAEEVRTGVPAGTNLHDQSWRDVAADSLARVRGLRPAVVELSHDPARLRLA